MSRTDARAKRSMTETFFFGGGEVDYHRNTERLAIILWSPLNIANHTNNLPDVVTLGEAYIGDTASPIGLQSILECSLALNVTAPLFSMR